MSSLILWCLLPQHIWYHKAATAEAGLTHSSAAVSRSLPVHSPAMASAGLQLQLLHSTQSPPKSWLLSPLPVPSHPLPKQQLEEGSHADVQNENSVELGQKDLRERRKGLSSLICSHSNAPVCSYGPACISPALPPPQNSCLTLCNALRPPQHSYVLPSNCPAPTLM